MVNQYMPISYSLTLLLRNWRLNDCRILAIESSVEWLWLSLLYLFWQTFLTFGILIAILRLCNLSIWRRKHNNVTQLPDIEGILPKGPFLPCVRTAGRALLAGYHRHVQLVSFSFCLDFVELVTKDSRPCNSDQLWFSFRVIMRFFFERQRFVIPT